MNSETVPVGATTISPRSALLAEARRLPDGELIARVKALAEGERCATAVLIAHLSVLDERQLYLDQGCGSLYTYLTQVLHLSEHAAYGRIQAARAARRYPIILELLADGSVTLTTITLLAPELTADNYRDLLGAVRHKSRRQVEELIARLRPRPPARSLIRRLPAPVHGSPPAFAACSTSADPMLPSGTDFSEGEPPSVNGASPRLLPPEQSPLAASSSALSLPVPSSPPAAPSVGPPGSASRTTVTPLSERYYRVQFTAGPHTHAKLRAAQDLLRHQIPDGDVGKIVDRALTALLNDLAKQKFGASERPRGTDKARTPPPRPRYIPADVRRAVWLRDGGRCAYTAANGRRCTERGFLEFHHVVPVSAGGTATIENIQLRCRAHNRYESEVLPGRPERPPEEATPS